MSAREPRPDALIVGAPKAGTSALHAALAQHPQMYASPVKEPKYYMCWDAPPPAYSGPGDAHSNQEWVWRREDYQALFQKAPEEAVRLESTPFYLYTRGARQRIAEELAVAKLIVIVRDPIDRAYSNWMHLWVDGLEPISDFVEAWRAEDRRVAAGWAPFWHYRRLGRYGEQLADLLGRVVRGTGRSSLGVRASDSRRRRSRYLLATARLATGQQTAGQPVATWWGHPAAKACARATQGAARRLSGRHRAPGADARRVV